MSDLSTQRLWHEAWLQPQGETTGAGRFDVEPAEIRFLRLKSPADIAEIVPLRHAIPLPVAAHEPAFAALEKKGTKSAWSGPSNTTAA